MSSSERKTAELTFRDAFERLKANKPRVLTPGTPVTQNNVAREAGRDPSALKKDRYPLLVLEIQAFTAGKKEQDKGKRGGSDNRSRTVQQRLTACQKQRDRLASIVSAQNELVRELLGEIEDLKVGKITRMN